MVDQIDPSDLQGQTHKQLDMSQHAIGHNPNDQNMGNSQQQQINQMQSQLQNQGINSPNYFDIQSNQQLQHIISQMYSFNQPQNINNNYGNMGNINQTPDVIGLQNMQMPQSNEGNSMPGYNKGPYL